MLYINLCYFLPSFAIKEAAREKLELQAELNAREKAQNGSELNSGDGTRPVEQNSAISTEESSFSGPKTPLTKLDTMREETTRGSTRPTSPLTLNSLRQKVALNQGQLSDINSFAPNPEAGCVRRIIARGLSQLELTPQPDCYHSASPL